MDQTINYIFNNLTLVHDIAPIMAFIVALLENKDKGVKNCFIVCCLSISIAGITEAYLPAHTFFIAMLVGIISGVSADDLYSKFTNKFPSLIEDTFDILSSGVLTFIKNIFKR